ncbi:SIR2 family protein [Cellulosimicrobium cellulans]|uniref:SIR2 family protein n=1 Tax=Cellulosimicrobium cellulans TaxID=1710 RepID=UPI003015B049
MNPGHLFVVNGRLESLSADAVIIPTDAGFHVERWWRGAAGLPPEGTWASLKPIGWERGSALPARAPRRSGRRQPEVWFLDTIASTPAGVGDSARRAVAAVVERSVDLLWSSARESGRDVPLIALPVIGTGYGGHRLRRGQVITQLLTSLHDVARTVGVDVALVASNRADYSALQHGRRALGHESGLGVEDTARAARLGRYAADGDLALFFGAGVSIAAGLPSWSRLLTELVARLDLDEDVVRRIDDLGPLEQAELVQVALADHSARAKADTQKALGSRVATIIRAASTRPSLAHTLLASMRVREAATTNYDQLYEAAVRATARSQADEQGSAVDVLPWDRTSAGRPWLLKMHGDVDHPDSIVLSRSSFVHYDSRWKPVGSLVQSLMLTKHLLVVGASMTDDNLLRFAYEVAGLRASIQTSGSAAPEIGTVVHLADDAAFSRLWKGRFDVVVPTIGTDSRDPVGSQDARLSAPHPEETGDERREREASERRRAARALTVFLDVVAMHVERDAPHLLDDRYAEERAGDAAHLVARVREVAAEARRIGDEDAWAQLADMLDQFGAGTRT